MNRLLRDAFAEYLEFGVRPVWFDNFSELPDLIRQLREMAEDAPPSWFGYSTGKWEGDTLVVDTKGFNGKAWIDQLGKPATEALHVIERFRRKDFGHLDIEVTIRRPAPGHGPSRSPQSYRTLSN